MTPMRRTLVNANYDDKMEAHSQHQRQDQDGEGDVEAPPEHHEPPVR